MNAEIYVSAHAMKRFKQRGKVKSIPKMYRRAAQAYRKGVPLNGYIVEYESFLFDGMVYIFSSLTVGEVILLTLYKATRSDALLA